MDVSGHLHTLFKKCIHQCLHPYTPSDTSVHMTCIHLIHQRCTKKDVYTVSEKMGCCIYTSIHLYTCVYSVYTGVFRCIHCCIQVYTLVYNVHWNMCWDLWSKFCGRCTEKLHVVYRFPYTMTGTHQFLEVYTRYTSIHHDSSSRLICHITPPHHNAKIQHASAKYCRCHSINCLFYLAGCCRRSNQVLISRINSW